MKKEDEKAPDSVKDEKAESSGEKAVKAKKGPEVPGAPAAADEKAGSAPGAEGGEQSASEDLPESDPVREDVSRLREIFPSLGRDDIPDEVWDRVEKGESLSGAYALWFLSGIKKKAQIDLVNSEVSKKAPPRMRHDGGDGDYFSPEEVKSMTQAQVRKNYDAILRSMDKWNRS